MRGYTILYGLVAVSCSSFVNGFSNLPLGAKVRASSLLPAGPNRDAESLHQNTNPLASLTVGAAMAIALLGGAEPATANSKTAAQVNLNSIPPASVELSIGDLPVVGNLLSGTYTKTDKVDNPSITILSPSDKLTAIKSIASAGHLEFDVNGKVKTHLDVDVATVRPGVAIVRVESPLIPGLPFKNKANSPEIKAKGKESDWNVVTNLGSGETMFYTNTKTGASQYEVPSGF